MSGMSNKEAAGLIGFGCLAIIALTVLWWIAGGFIIMIAWNALLPYLLGAPVISWEQGIAAAVLISIVGGAFRATVNQVNK